MKICLVRLVSCNNGADEEHPYKNAKDADCHLNLFYGWAALLSKGEYLSYAERGTVFADAVTRYTCFRSLRRNKSKAV